MKHSLFAAFFLFFPLIAAEGVTVTVTGRTLQVEDQKIIPLGIFGVHAVGITNELIDDLGITCTRGINFVPSGSSVYQEKESSPAKLNPVFARLPVIIDCEGDRFYRPLPLLKPDYAEYCKKIGASYGEIWKEMGANIPQQGIVQWWNEPYLNWAERSAGGHGSVINQECYDLTKAVEGGRVTIKGWTEPLTYFRWRSLWPTRMGEEYHKKTKKNVPVRIIGWNIPLPAGAKVGDRFKAASNRYWMNPGKEFEWTVEERWYPVDPTAVSYWSGRQNLDFYTWSFEPWARSLRETNPKVTILAGWDFNFSAGRWSCFEELYRPLLQKFPTLIDGLTEHHYGIDPPLIQAWYELGVAEADAISQRRIKIYNTECQGCLDPAVYASANANSGVTTGAIAMNEANYNLTDMIGLMARMPEKVGSRTIHNFAGGKFMQCGGAWALRLLKPLRGDLLEIHSGDVQILAVACRNMDGNTILAITNAATIARVINLHQESVSDAKVRRLILDAQENLTIDERALEGPIILEPCGSVVVVMAKPPPAKGSLIRRQFFPIQGGLRRCLGKPFPMTINLPQPLPKNLSAARLRFVLDEYSPDGVTLMLGKDTPPTKTQEIGWQCLQLVPQQFVNDVDLPLTALKPGANTLWFTGGKALIVTASIILEETR